MTSTLDLDLPTLHLKMHVMEDNVSRQIVFELENYNIVHPSKSFIDLLPLSINNIIGSKFKDEVELNNAIDSVFGSNDEKSAASSEPQNMPTIFTILSQDSADLKQASITNFELLHISSEKSGDTNQPPLTKPEILDISFQDSGDIKDPVKSSPEIVNLCSQESVDFKPPEKSAYLQILI